jgi:hypothetical protein
MKLFLHLVQDMPWLHTHISCSLNMEDKVLIIGIAVAVFSVYYQLVAIINSIDIYWQILFVGSLHSIKFS